MEESIETIHTKNNWIEETKRKIYYFLYTTEIIGKQLNQSMVSKINMFWDVCWKMIVNIIFMDIMSGIENGINIDIKTGDKSFILMFSLFCCVWL